MYGMDRAHCLWHEMHDTQCVHCKRADAQWREQAAASV